MSPSMNSLFACMCFSLYQKGHLFSSRSWCLIWQTDCGRSDILRANHAELPWLLPWLFETFVLEAFLLGTYLPCYAQAIWGSHVGTVSNKFLIDNPSQLPWSEPFWMSSWVQPSIIPAAAFQLLLHERPQWKLHSWAWEACRTVRVCHNMLF
jgi:hypothetical protein